MISRNRKRVGGALHVFVAILALLAFVGGLAACSEEASALQAADDGSSEPTDDGGEQPADDSGAGDDGSDEPEGEDDSDDGSSAGDWLLLILIAALGLAIVLIAASASSRRSQRKQVAMAAISADVGEIVGASRWIHDQGSIEVLRAADTVQANSVWAGVRMRMLDVESRVAAALTSQNDIALGQSISHVGQAVAELRGALETEVAVKADPNADAQLRQSATQTVYARREQLSAAINGLHAQLRGPR